MLFLKISYVTRSTAELNMLQEDPSTTETIAWYPRESKGIRASWKLANDMHWNFDVTRMRRQSTYHPQPPPPADGNKKAEAAATIAVKTMKTRIWVDLLLQSNPPSFYRTWNMVTP
ncbi:unnamed protein product [Caenorhabditis bovis]|uniref:Uncharacterized protein n=1 Tax=Caenorhabditis bovis TaxID=2654633 RepID=A0A8S1E6F6_9PELO|nr:unnamed protein product [Caenorhabditis bovis]